MTEDKIENLLQKADRAAGPPAPVGVNVPALRRRANRRRLATMAVPVAAAAVVLIALAIRTRTTKAPGTVPGQDKIVALEAQVKQLQARTDATLNLVHEVLEAERKQRRLNELQAELASIPDPLEEIEKQVDKTAFTLIYRADHLYYELSQTDSAVEAYNQVIILFPKNRWADVARQRLAEIENRQLNKTINKTISEGDLI